MGRLTKTAKPTTLLAWRQAKQLTQTQAAEVFGITQARWSLYETGQGVPRRKMAKRIADTTGLPLEKILGLDNESYAFTVERPNDVA